MATWGEFIAEIPIINKRSEGIFVKADHVLDLWAERNSLRDELASSRPVRSARSAAEPVAERETVPLADPVADYSGEAAARERESCAREVEEFALTCPVDPAWREFTVQLLRTAPGRGPPRGRLPPRNRTCASRRIRLDLGYH